MGEHAGPVKDQIMCILLCADGQGKDLAVGSTENVVGSWKAVVFEEELWE